jgi:hypothetical protein
LETGYLFGPAWKPNRAGFNSASILFEKNWAEARGGGELDTGINPGAIENPGEFKIQVKFRIPVRSRITIRRIYLWR